MLGMWRSLNLNPIDFVNFLQVKNLTDFKDWFVSD